MLGWPDFFLIYRAIISAIYIYIGTDKTVTRTMVVNIKRMAHVCSNTFLSIFSKEGHHRFLEDGSITLIEKTEPPNPLQREHYWRSTLTTMAPWGLNVEDCA